MSSPRRPRPSTSVSGAVATASTTIAGPSSRPTTPAKPSSSSVAAAAAGSASRRAYLPAVSSPLKLAPLSSSPLRFQVERSPRGSNGLGSVQSSRLVLSVSAPEAQLNDNNGESTTQIASGGEGAEIDAEDEDRVQQALLADENQYRHVKKVRTSIGGSFAATAGRRSRTSQSATGPGDIRFASTPTKSLVAGTVDAHATAHPLISTDDTAPPADSPVKEAANPSNLSSTDATEPPVEETFTFIDDSRLARLQRGLERFLGLLDGKSDLDHFLQAFPTLTAEEVQPVQVKFVEDIKNLIKSGHHSLIESYDLLERLPLLERLCLEADRRADRGLPLDHDEMRDVFRADLDISTALHAKALQGRRERVVALEQQLDAVQTSNTQLHHQLLANVAEADQKQAEAKAVLDALEEAIRHLQPDAAMEKRLRSTLSGLAGELGPRV